MKYIKENAYIFVGALLILSLLTILINSIYAGYVQYNTEKEPTMYGLMYVAPDGSKEYLRNTSRGETTEDINDIAELAQKKTAEKAAKSLLKSGWLEDAGGEIYVIEVVKIAVNPELVSVKKKKSGYVIEMQNLTSNDELETRYYCGPLKREYYSSSSFMEQITPATRFSTEAKALESITRFIKDIRSGEELSNLQLQQWSPARRYSKHFANYTERNDYIEKTMRVIHIDEDN